MVFRFPVRICVSISIKHLGFLETLLYLDRCIIYINHKVIEHL